jgi:hypothetical protein
VNGPTTTSTSAAGAPAADTPAAGTPGAGTPAVGIESPGARAGALSRERFGVADELTCYYDRPVEPANVHVEARVPGELDEACIRAAVRAVLQAEPGVRVRQAATSRWRPGYYWEFPDEPDVDPVRVTAYADEAELAALRSALLSDSPSLRAAPPVRFLLAPGPAGAAFILNAHHARFDGLACLRLFREVAQKYTELRGGVLARGDDPPEPPACPLGCPPIHRPFAGPEARTRWAGNGRLSVARAGGRHVPTVCRAGGPGSLGRCDRLSISRVGCLPGAP